MPSTPYPTVQRRARIETRKARLEALGYRDYPHYLSSPAWHDTRRRYFESDQPQDCICGETYELQLHHLTYERVGEEELTDLTPMCKRCHSMLHELERRGEVGLDFQGFVNEERARLHRLAIDRRKQKTRSEDEEYELHQRFRQMSRDIKSATGRIRNAARNCIKAEIAIDDELERLADVARALESKYDRSVA